MNYSALHISLSDEHLAEILIAELAEFPFESFESDCGILKAYIPCGQLPACRTEVEALLRRYGVEGRYVTIEAEDWNASWERDFPPTDVEGRLLIRAPYHAPAPAGVLEAVVMPRMSFGSGRHATTWLMAREVLRLRVAGRRGLDVGCGTGVLSIVAAKCGAAHMDAVDIDGRAVANCRDNASANGVSDRITSIEGDVGSVAGRHYDFILANINRNTLLRDMSAYAAALWEGGDLVMSGFLSSDVEAVVSAAAARGLEAVVTCDRAEWNLVRVRKP